MTWNLFGLLTQIYLISVLFLLNPICPDAYIEILKRETKDLPDLSKILKLAAENFFSCQPATNTRFLIWTLILHLWQYAWPTFFGLIKYHWPFEDLMFNCRRLSHPLWHNITCSVRTPLSGSPTSLSSSFFSFFQLLVLTVYSFPFNRAHNSKSCRESRMSNTFPSLIELSLDLRIWSTVWDEFRPMLHGPGGCESPL